LDAMPRATVSRKILKGKNGRACRAVTAFVLEF
jgi:hypothetical protein